LQATHARYWVITFGVTLAILAFVDRVCISQAAPLIARDLGFDKAQMGTVFGAFLLSYGLFEIPGAWYGDLVGARKGLIRIVSAWSLFTGLTGWAWSFRSMVAVRFLFGVGEAGCFPIITKAFRVWLPLSDRTRAQGILWTSARWGGAFTPLLVVWVLRYMSWRWSFVLFGSLGVIWAVLFSRWYRDDPEDHPSVNAAERELLAEKVPENSTQSHRVPWGALLRSRSVLLLSVQYFFVSFSWYFYLTWLPTYLQEHHHLTSERSAAYAVFPLLFCGIGSLFCGFITQRVVGWTHDIRQTRRIMACAGFLGAGCFLALATRMPDVNWTMAMMAAACFFNDQVIPHSWASCMDIGGRHAASSVAGTMNLMGNLAGTASSVLGGYLLQRSGNDWNLFISVLAGVYFLGIFCWPFIDPEAPLQEAPVRKEDAKGHRFIRSSATRA
jgi:ACS family glucarate transporter-like MFS transporter